MVVMRYYDGENAIIRKYDGEIATVRWFKRDAKSHYRHCTIILSRNFTIDHSIVLSSSYYRVFTIVISLVTRTHLQLGALLFDFIDQVYSNLERLQVLVDL